MRRALLMVAGLAAGTLILVAFLAAGAGLGSLRTLDFYVQVDDDTILVQTIGGRNEWTRVVELEETADAVHVVVRGFTWPIGAGGSVGHEIRLAVDLGEPLGHRRVFDAFHEVPSREEFEGGD